MCSSCEEPVENNVQWGIFHSKINGSKIYEFLKRHWTWLFMPQAWKVCRGHLVIGSSVRLFVRPSVRNSVPLTNKVQYLKFVWWYSNQTWTVSSCMGSSHFTDITYPWGGAGSKYRTLRFLPYFDFVSCRGHLCFTNTCLVLHKNEADEE